MNKTGSCNKYCEDNNVAEVLVNNLCTATKFKNGICNDECFDCTFDGSKHAAFVRYNPRATVNGVPVDVSVGSMSKSYCSGICDT